MKSSELRKLQRQATKELKTRKDEARKTLMDSLPSDWLGVLKQEYGSVANAANVMGVHETSPYNWFYENRVPHHHLPALLDVLKIHNPQGS